MKPISVSLCGAIFLLVGHVQAQTLLDLSGRVIDGQTGRPIPYASIYINTSTRGTLADTSGYYRLAGLPVGTVEVVASAVGYQIARQMLRSNSEARRPLNFSLTADPNALEGITVKAKRPTINFCEGSNANC
jgi:hypothetical protein